MMYRLQFLLTLIMYYCILIEVQVQVSYQRPYKVTSYTPGSNGIAAV